MASDVHFMAMHQIAARALAVHCRKPWIFLAWNTQITHGPVRSHAECPGHPWVPTQPVDRSCTTNEKFWRECTIWEKIVTDYRQNYLNRATRYRNTANRSLTDNGTMTSREKPLAAHLLQTVTPDSVIVGPVMDGTIYEDHKLSTQKFSWVMN